ncbi:MAG: type II toxin-antitoxin system prevent-host-death family antitoxin [Turneriella sp.]|nr:type II toxin-antitoxin system prevent-host-death family antitoxin [Turneriella sp.]
MNVSAKELRKEPGKILKKVARGEQIVVTYRGKKMAKFVRLEEHSGNQAKAAQGDKDEIFGLWKNHENTQSVDDHIRRLRKGRSF